MSKAWVLFTTELGLTHYFSPARFGFFDTGLVALPYVCKFLALLCRRTGFSMISSRTFLTAFFAVFGCDNTLLVPMRIGPLLFESFAVNRP